MTKMYKIMFIFDFVHSDPKWTIQIVVNSHQVNESIVIEIRGGRSCRSWCH